MWTWIWFYFSLLTAKDWLWTIQLSKGLSNNYEKSCCLQLNFTQRFARWVPNTPCAPQLHFHKSEFWNSEPQQHFYMHQILDIIYHFRQSESSYSTDIGLSESSDSTRKKTTPPCRHLPNLWWHRTVKERKKSWFSPTSADLNPRLCHQTCNGEEFGTFAPG